MKVPHIYLASSSPRRRQLLEQLGIRHHVVEQNVDETPLGDESPESMVRRLALLKAQAGQDALRGDPDALVLGADTCIALDGEVLGKPQARDHGLLMLGRLAGRRHDVYSAVALVRGTESVVSVSISRVTFRPMTAREIAAYWDSGEPADKAGGYAVQGRGAIFVQHLEGSYSGVMGLPLYETAVLLEQFGLELL